MERWYGKILLKIGKLVRRKIPTLCLFKRLFLKLYMHRLLYHLHGENERVICKKPAFSPVQEDFSRIQSCFLSYPLQTHGLFQAKGGPKGIKPGFYTNKMIRKNIFPQMFLGNKSDRYKRMRHLFPVPNSCIQILPETMRFHQTIVNQKETSSAVSQEIFSGRQVY